MYIGSEWPHKNFGDFHAVKGISFSIDKGEIFGFLGPNGAGKTTTINMLTGLARPTAGTIRIADIDGIGGIKKVQQIIGSVPDESNLYDEMSGLDNLTFCASLYGIGKKESLDRAQELLRQFDLADTGKKPFRAYSKGMKRKLTIAAGIIHHPEILFLDEPTTGIDVESARQIRKMILDMNQKGTTVFLTTHYIEEAERLCHRIGFIVGGSLVAIGRTHDLLLEAQKECIVEFSLENEPTALGAALSAAFPDMFIQYTGNHSVRISSPVQIDLMPFMKFFDAGKIRVWEAKIIHPSLEDVFVKVTGIERDRMKKEKESAKR